MEVLKKAIDNVKNLVSIMFNPYSPITILIVSFFINVISTSTNSPNYIKNLSSSDNIKRIQYIIILWLIITVFYTTWKKQIDIMSEKIGNLKETINEKQRHIEQNAGVILNKYGELAKFNKKQRFYDVLKSFVDNNTLVQSAQLYSYSMKVENSNIVKIRLKLEEGYTYENVDINGILQSYFLLELDEFKELKDIIELWKLLYYNEEVEDIENDCLLKEFLDRAPKLLQNLVEKLNNIENIKSCNEFNYSQYRIVLILLKILYTEYNGIETIQVLEEEEVEKYLINTKRTGILGAILLQDTYIFKHVGNSLKNGRMYYSIYLKIYDENYVLLIAIPPNELSDKIKWEKELFKLKDDFIQRMENTNA